MPNVLAGGPALLPQKSCVDLRGETKFRRKFFAKLSFKKAGGETLRHSLRADEDIGPYGRGGRGETKFRRKFFCLLFLQEK